MKTKIIVTITNDNARIFKLYVDFFLYEHFYYLIFAVYADLANKDIQKYGLKVLRTKSQDGKVSLNIIDTESQVLCAIIEQK